MTRINGTYAQCCRVWAIITGYPVREVRLLRAQARGAACARHVHDQPQRVTRA